jgi:hypothetical protein
VRRWVSASGTVIFLALLRPLVAAQSAQSWPEVDTYLKLSSNVRVSFYAALTRENTTGSSAEIGPNIDFFLKPLVKLKRITAFQLDQSKDRPVMLRLGYRYMPSTDGTVEHRGFAEATGRYPLLRGVLLSDRNRVEFRDISGQFFWRYRNRLSAERTFAIHGYHFTPYLRAEAFYDEKVSKWSRTALTAGSTFPIGKRFELEWYYEHQNDTASPPNREVNGLGYVFSMYF